MFTQDSLATAQIAKIFGSELLKVQESARTDSGTQPSILNMHPTQFLGANAKQQERNKQNELEILRRLQAEAESAYPIAQETPPPPPPSQNLQPQTSQNKVNPVDVIVNEQTQVKPQANFDSKELSKLNDNLERIATILEKGIDMMAQLSNKQ